MENKQHLIYIICVVLLFGGMTLTLNFFKRSHFSKTERRELAKFPDLTICDLASGKWTNAVSKWYSDTEPYREKFMDLSMEFKKKLAFEPFFLKTEDNITFHADESSSIELLDPDAVVLDGTIEEYENKLTAKEEKTKIGSRGILVIGEAPTARALMIFGAGYNGAIGYAEMANEYQFQLSSLGIQVYVMPIPSAIEFYCPDKAKNVMKPQSETIRGIYENLKFGVKPVDVYTVLGRHAAEPIFLRTDHHWAPLGAYYAAKQFAAVANVPFIDISKYKMHIVANFIGTMYGYSKDVAIKKSPEDFVWYEPIGVRYETSYINYVVNDNFEVVSESKETPGKYFYSNIKGGMAYSIFMGGDTKITKVVTSTKNGRRLLIIKDSFGNALPGFLFGSFEEIHVIDCRYFTKNIKTYCKKNCITDLLFANNTFKCCERSLWSKVKKFLKQ